MIRGSEAFKEGCSMGHAWYAGLCPGVLRYIDIAHSKDHNYGVDQGAAARTTRFAIDTLIVDQVAATKVDKI